MTLPHGQSLGYTVSEWVRRVSAVTSRICLSARDTSHTARPAIVTRSCLPLPITCSVSRTAISLRTLVQIVETPRARQRAVLAGFTAVDTSGKLTESDTLRYRVARQISPISGQQFSEFGLPRRCRSRPSRSIEPSEGSHSDVGLELFPEGEKVTSPDDADHRCGRERDLRARELPKRAA